MYINAYQPFGYDGILVRVEADIRRGIPGLDMTGLAQGAVREAAERVRAAFRNSGFQFPQDRILINFAPAELRKTGSALDLPLALAIMCSANLAPAPKVPLMALGELELSGRLRPVHGVLAAAARALENGITHFIVPAENAAEAAILAKNKVAGVSTLTEAVRALEELRADSPAEQSLWGLGGNLPDLAHTAAANADGSEGDFAEVRGQKHYKRALEIAAAGGHNVLAFGPPGSGKTMLARRFPTIMAPLTETEAVEVMRVRSLAGLTQGGTVGATMSLRPPFRSPHHSASAEGVLGGGRSVKPGEISLAHNGALFLDEAPEFKTHVLQALREPLEDRAVTISRAEGSARLPANFQLLLAANLCPCGKLGRRTNPGEAGCSCSGSEIARYWRKFGGALLDRVEIRVPVFSTESEKMIEVSANEEKSAAIAARVEKAVEIQRRRFGKEVRRNAGMNAGLVERHCVLEGQAKTACAKAIEKLRLSGRALHGILRLSRTIADLAGSESIGVLHVLEAVELRRWGDDPYDIFQTLHAHIGV